MRHNDFRWNGLRVRRIPADKMPVEWELFDPNLQDFCSEGWYAFDHMNPVDNAVLKQLNHEWSRPGYGSLIEVDEDDEADER